MGFLLYNISEASDSSLSFSNPRPIKLTGEEGPIARFVKNHPEPEKGWKISEEQLLRLFVDEVRDEKLEAVVFDSDPSSESRAGLSRVISIAGKSASDNTEMIIHFQDILVGQVEQAREVCKSFKVPADKKLPEHHDPVAMSGGTSEGSWKWCKSEENIGATIYRGASSNS